MIWNIPTKDTDGNPPPPPPPATIPEPTAREKEVIRLVCLKMPHVDGMVPSPKKIGRLFYVSGGNNEYPSNPNTVIEICEWLLTFDNSQLYDQVQ